MLLSILLQAIGGIGLTKLGAAIGAGIAVLGAGIGIQQRAYESDHRGSFDRRCSPHRHCRLSFDIVPLNRCCLWDC